MGCNKQYVPADFLGLDFLVTDFFTESIQGSSEVTVVFKNYLFEKLPTYFLKQDTYKNGSGEGLLQRYLTISGDYLDEYVMGEIECYLNVIDASLTPSQHIDNLSKSLGSPPDIFKDEARYRNLLQYITTVYKVKGTIRAYELFFNILGFDIILTEVPPLELEDLQTRYDNAGQYDIGDIYDADECQPCTEYDIAFIPFNNQFTGVNEQLLNRINQSIAFNEPINAKLRNLTMGIQLQDTLNVTIAEEATENVI